MNYEVPQLVPVEEIQQILYMIQVAHGSEGETYPGQPVAVFYNYAAARSAFDAYEDPMAEYRYGQNGIMAYLVGSNVNASGILSNSRLYRYEDGGGKSRSKCERSEGGDGKA